LAHLEILVSWAPENFCTNFGFTAWPFVYKLTTHRRQTDRMTDRQTDRQTRPLMWPI